MLVLVWQPIEDCLLPLSVFRIVPAAMEGCCCWDLPLLVNNSTIPPMLKSIGLKELILSRAIRTGSQALCLLDFVLQGNCQESIV